MEKCQGDNLCSSLSIVRKKEEQCVTFISAEKTGRALSAVCQEQINQMFCCARGNHTICQFASNGRAATKKLAQLNPVDMTKKVIYYELERI